LKAHDEALDVAATNDMNCNITDVEIARNGYGYRL